MVYGALNILVVGQVSNSSDQIYVRNKNITL